MNDNLLKYKLKTDIMYIIKTELYRIAYDFKITLVNDDNIHDVFCIRIDIFLHSKGNDSTVNWVVFDIDGYTWFSDKKYEIINKKLYNYLYILYYRDNLINRNSYKIASKIYKLLIKCYKKFTFIKYFK